MTAAAYDDLVTRLEAAGVAHDAAHRRAAMEYPDAAADRAREAERRENVLEKAEQLEVAKLFRNFGFEVYNLSQARASKQSAGIPDLWCMHRDQPIGFWWETKRASGGQFSEAQLRFREQAIRCGVGYGCGDRRAAQTHVINLGLAHVDAGGVLEPIRRTG